MMIGIVDRYVARTFLAGYFILLAVGIGFYILVDALVNLDEFTSDASLSGWEMARNMIDYYGYNVPLYFSQLAGPMMCIAAAFTTAVMLKNNELVSLVASGVPLRRVCVPLLASAMVLVMLWVANRELLLPNIAHKVVRKRGNIEGQAALNVNCVRTDHGAVLIALRYFPREERMERVAIVEQEPDGRAASLVEADSASYDPSTGLWLLERGRRMKMRQESTEGIGENIDYVPVETYDLRMTPDTLLLRQSSESADLLSARQLRKLARTRNIANRAAIESNLHVRLTQPMVQLLLILLATSFFLTREPTNVLAAGGRSLLLTGLFFGATFLVQNMLRLESTALTAWLPILAFGPVAVLRLANLRS